MRAAFAENARLDVGKRTKKAAELVKVQILALAPEADADKLAKKALENAGIKSDDKGTKALFFMSTAQAKALAELAVEGSADKKQYRDALKAAPSMDMALFGRMVADDPSLNYDAAAQVAHSISTHAVQNEYDYFTAVDDCQAEDNAGASHLGTVEYNSSTLYRYATVNMVELVHLLGAEKAAQAVRVFGEAFIRSMRSIIISANLSKAACPALPELVPNAIILVIHYLTVHLLDVRLFDIKLCGFVRRVCAVRPAPVQIILRVLALRHKAGGAYFSFLKEFHQLLMVHCC